MIFSYYMELGLGGMQPLVPAMPEVVLVSTILGASPGTSPEIRLMLDAKEREFMGQQARHAGILARLA